ncbi:flagellar export protein FliJ [Ornithinibacillus salinisoli]|uniref:Flagellar FliJ protein n=1 Tax=Ornithinibacillus salinisoli TaxID=1848459 RepID=A0ABW4VX48_9BACI
MANMVAINKILNIREKEKKDAQHAYQQSMDDFERIATTLYTLLRKKEVAEQAYEDSLQEATQINSIKDQLEYIEMLNKQISNLQQEVQQARTVMETKQSNLTSAHVEVKKYEKIIEFRHNKNEKEEKRLENFMMDEVSIQQFLSYKNR